MQRDLQRPITCLITSGETTSATTDESDEFLALLSLVRSAVAARVALVQLREKNLNARTLYELASRAAALARGSRTRILVNDRADIARASGCDGVQLTTRSLDPTVIRRAFGEDFLIGVSAHTLAELRGARDGGADFAVFGPVFDTPSKRAYGPPLGLEALREAAPRSRHSRLSPSAASRKTTCAKCCARARRASRRFAFSPTGKTSRERCITLRACAKV